MTINEPLQTAVNGYGLGVFATGRNDHSSTETYLAAHHQLLAHAAAFSIYESKYKVYHNIIFCVITIIFFAGWDGWFGGCLLCGWLVKDFVMRYPYPFAFLEPPYCVASEGTLWHTIYNERHFTQSRKIILEKCKIKKRMKLNKNNNNNNNNKTKNRTKGHTKRPGQLGCELLLVVFCFIQIIFFFIKMKVLVFSCQRWVLSKIDLLQLRIEYFFNTQIILFFRKNRGGKWVWW